MAKSQPIERDQQVAQVARPRGRRQHVDDLHARGVAGHEEDQREDHQGHQEQHRDHDQEKDDLVPVVDANAIGQLQADAAGADDAEDGRRTGVRFDVYARRR